MFPQKFAQGTIILEHPEQVNPDLAAPIKFLFYPLWQVIVAPLANTVSPNLSCSDYLKFIYPLYVKLVQEHLEQNEPYFRWLRVLVRTLATILLAVHMHDGFATLRRLPHLNASTGLRLGSVAAAVFLFDFIAEYSIEAILSKVVRSTTKEKAIVHAQFILAHAKKCPFFIYARSCEACKLSEDRILSCKCSTKMGSLADTSIDTKICTEEIRNCNGYLACTDCPFYTSTCEECKLSIENILSCKCSIGNGYRADTSIDAKTCTDGIRNCNGNLICGRSCPLYTQSCQACKLSTHGLLSCNCSANGRDQKKQTSINTSKCTEEIHNCNGSLVCGKTCPFYTQTCEECSLLEDGILSCKCPKKGYLDLEDTSIDTKICNEEIHNCNGRLVCGNCPDTREL